MVEKIKKTTLGLAERLGFAAISIADNLRSSYLNTFMLFFCTNVLGCRPGIISTLLSVSTVWDAINDPMIASYADNHPNRNGDRSRQYLFASIPGGIILVLLFSHLFHNPTASTIFVFVLFLISSVFTTFHRLPFYAMMILVSPEEEDRISVSKFHFFGTAIGVALGSVIMWPLVRLVGGVDAAGNVANPDKGFLAGAVIVAAAIIALSLYHYFTSKERIRPQKVEKTPMIKAIRILFKKARFRRNVILDFLRSTIITATTGYGLYYATYVLGKPGMLTLLSAVYLFSSMLFLPFVGRIIRKLGIRKSLIVSAVILIAAEVVFVIMPKTLIGGIAVVFACGVSTSLINVALSLNRARIADEVEEAEGRRVDSMVSNVNGLAVKCGASLIGLVFGWILEFTHYDGSLSVQPDSAVKGIIFIMGWMVIICCAGLILAAPKEEPAKIAGASAGTEGE